MAFDGYGRRQPFTALTRPRTVYVDSATGDDNTGDGTQAKPWETLQRAWIERLQYVEIRADFVIQLIGAGPYVIDFPLGASMCGPEGRVIVLGDDNWNVTDSGTATGDMVGQTVPTSAIINGGAANYQWVRFTSGACQGCLFLLNDTAANSFTVANSTARVSAGPIVNGDTFQMVEPITQIQFVPPSTPTDALFQINGLEGAFSGSGTMPQQPCHWFFGIAFAGATSMRVQGSRLGMSFCRVGVGAAFQECEILHGGASPESRLPGSLNGRLFGAGTVFNALASYADTNVRGVVSNSSFSSYVGSSRFLFAGGRIGHPVLDSLVVSGAIEAFGGANENRRLMATLQVEGPSAAARINGQGAWISAVSAGSCVRARRGASIVVQFSGAGSWTGGTADAAGYGVDVRGGGRCLFVNTTPAVTGGTAGDDLRTTNATEANAALNANDQAVGDAADALLGEVLARVA